MNLKENNAVISGSGLSGLSLNYLSLQALDQGQLLSEFWRDRAEQDGSLRVDQETYNTIVGMSGQNAPIADTEAVNTREISAVRERTSGTFRIHIGDSIAQQLEQRGFYGDTSGDVHVGLNISGADTVLMGRVLGRLPNEPFSSGTEITFHLRIGFNDIKNWLAQDGSESGLEATRTSSGEALRGMIRHLRNLHPQSGIVVESILPVGEQTAYGDGTILNQAITQLNQSFQAIAQQEGVTFSDDSSRFSENGALRQDFAGSDGVHLSEAGLAELLRSSR